MAKLYFRYGTMDSAKTLNLLAVAHNYRKQGKRVKLRLAAGTRLVMLGGDALDGPRHMYWNFVSSRPERIERAKQDWKAQAFPKVPGDDQEFIPLPE